MKQPLQLSIIVIVYRMQKQAMNTLYSLSSSYQKNIGASDYEVIVVENASESTLDTVELNNLEGNFRYFLRQESGVSPAPAINFALSKCKGEMIGLMIDGARMVTPRVIAHVLSMKKIFAQPLVAVPGYHLSEQIQEHSESDLSTSELAWLENINWKADGYRLFESACFSPGNSNGYFHPLMECTALFAHSRCFAAINGADQTFALRGGGSLNLHMYRQLGLLPDQKLIVLPGEGNFHQYHGGVTTSSYENRDQLINTFNDQLNSFWSGQYTALSKEPLLFGQIPPAAQKFLVSSCIAGIRRFSRLTKIGSDLWPDDPQKTGKE